MTLLFLIGRVELMQIYFIYYGNFYCQQIKKSF